MRTRHDRPLGSARWLFPIALVAAAAVPSVAAAQTTVTRSGNTITLTGDDAADTISGSGPGSERFVTFTAPSGPSITPGAGCQPVVSHGHTTRTVRCGQIAKPNNPITLRASLGGGDDRLTLAWRSDRHPRAIVDAGAGNDYVSGSILADDLSGGPGNDTLLGGADIDNLNGGAGDDELIGGEDGDHLAGGTGVDRLYGDGVPSSAVVDGYAGGDTIDSFDFPTDPNDLLGMTPEQIAALGNEVDTVDCGVGDDAANVDGVDAVDPDCEIKTGGQTTPTRVLTDQLPYMQLVVPRPRYRLADLLRGLPLRYQATPSAKTFLDAQVRLSASDARRYHVKPVIGGAAPVVITAPTITYDLFLRLNFDVRTKLARAHDLHATLRVGATIQGTTGPVTVHTDKAIVLR
jgi:hypothetical protein